MPYGSGGVPRTVELNQLFNLSKDKYVDTLHEKIKRQLDMYMNVRRSMKDPSKSPEILEKIRKTYKDLRDKISVTKETIPGLLRDIFDLFVDTHQKKSILANRGLIDELQKRKIRQAVLLCCAFCGPDSEFESSKATTSKFIDLERVAGGDEEYEIEGVCVSIKWYMGILEGHTSIKKNSDTLKKLK